MSIDAMIEVLKAYKEGKKIEFRSKMWPDWMVCDSEPYWNFQHVEYRVAP